MVLVKPWSRSVPDIRRIVLMRMADLGVVPHVIDVVLNQWQKAGRIGAQNRLFGGKVPGSRRLSRVCATAR